MTVPIGGLREHLEAASAREGSFARVRSQVVSHGRLLRKSVPASVADKPLLEPPGVSAALPDHLVGLMGWFILLNIFAFCFQCDG